MKIRNKIIALMISLIAMPTFAYSQAKNFAGPSLAGYGAFVSHTIKSDFNDGTTKFHIVDLGGNDIEYGLDLGYSSIVNNNFLIGVGVTHSLNDTDAGKFLVLDFKAKDHKSIYVQPTYVLNNNFAAFAKLGYHEIEGVGKLTTDLTVNGQTLLAGSTKEKFKGMGYGFGLKGLINENIYIQAEAQFIDYDKEGGGSNASAVSFEPDTVSGIISIGYKF